MKSNFQFLALEGVNLPLNARTPLSLIGPVDSEEKTFEIVDGLTDAGATGILLAFGSDELKCISTDPLNKRLYNIFSECLMQLHSDST